MRGQGVGGEVVGKRHVNDDGDGDDDCDGGMQQAVIEKAAKNEL